MFVIGIAIGTLCQRSKKAAKEIPAFTSERSEFDVDKLEVEGKELAGNQEVGVTCSPVKQGVGQAKYISKFERNLALFEKCVQGGRSEPG